MNIPFNVSARMALLIGRESIPSSNGAIGEVVKNGYDADASEITVIFDVPFYEVPKTILKDRFTNLINKYKKMRCFSSDVISNVSSLYEEQGEFFVLINQEIESKVLYRFFNSFNRIIFIDNGEGMTSEIIKKYWMTIGTHNKLSNTKTKNGRNRVGSKGIGRFSLDKLGENCEMSTKGENNDLVKWLISWNDFEKEEAVITDINASLDEFSDLKYKDIILQKVENISKTVDMPSYDYKSGTIISISSLREQWNIERLIKLKRDLLSLIPINIFNPFRIYFISNQFPELSEEIKRPMLSDFDYRVKFTLKKDVFEAKIERSEFNYHIMNSELTELILKNLESKYKENELIKHSLECSKYRFKIDDIIDPNIETEVVKKIGDFSFAFDYFKLTTTRDDTKKYFYKTFNSRDRKVFLEENSGVKIYRDGFRVRPYGEKESYSYDWLGLGLKATANPASMTHKGGTWYIRPNQIFGRVNISRDNNPKLLDNASRQGIDQSGEFETFANVLQYLISLFEKDRVIVATSILQFNKDEIEKQNRQRELKKAIAKVENNQDTTNEETKNIVESFRQQEEEIKALNYELNILKSYSTSSMFTRVFSHEINHVNNNLVSKIDQITPLIFRIITEQQLEGIEERHNPFISLKSMKEDIGVLDSYITIMTSNSIKDKRKRKDTDMYVYFNKMKENWSQILSARDIDININSDRFTFKCFDFDVFSIVTNLIINSSEAFLEEHFNGERKIILEAKNINGEFVLQYSDSGPGLNERIKNPYDIFEKEFTTKKNGTGIGMWILQTLVNEYKGTVTLKDVKNGFNLDIVFPKGVKEIG
jgi:signal transduction histidine kinase